MDFYITYFQKMSNNPTRKWKFLHIPKSEQIAHIPTFEGLTLKYKISLLTNSHICPTKQILNSPNSLQKLTPPSALFSPKISRAAPERLSPSVRLLTQYHALQSLHLFGIHSRQQRFHWAGPGVNKFRTRPMMKEIPCGIAFFHKSVSHR